MKPLVLFAAGESDADFLYATRMSVGEAVYVRFADGDDLLVVPTLELERARRQATPGCVIDRLEAQGFEPRLAGAGSWTSRCPAHDGSRHNLSINPGDDGRGGGAVHPRGGHRALR